MEIERFLDILGNVTRREILQMLTERRCYVSQISEELNIGQKAIIAHLEIMEQAGLLEPHFEKVEKGRPRKYFHVTKNIVMEVNLLPSRFDLNFHSPCMDERIIEDFPRLKELYLNFGSALLGTGKLKMRNLSIIADELLKERQRLTEAKNVIDFLLNEAQAEVEEERIRENLKKTIL